MKNKRVYTLVSVESNRGYVCIYSCGFDTITIKHDPTDCHRLENIETKIEVWVTA